VIGDVSISEAGLDRLDGLRDLFLAMHAHHRTISALPLVEDDDIAWRDRLATYQAWFDQGRALLYVAECNGSLVGYALTVIHEGSDDTFPLAPRYVEIYSLSVGPEQRGGRIGTQLLDALDERLRELKIGSLVIAVMMGNDEALRFYTRRGLAPGELILYRFDLPQLRN
jgi:ribosomal protein S18 acetylase RimI-like enzyme